MSEYTLPSGRASIETAGGPMSETEYAYPVAGKDKTIQELLTECWKLNAEVERLKRYECSWTDCGEKKKNKELQAEVDRYRELHRAIQVESLQAEVERYRELHRAILALEGSEGNDRCQVTMRWKLLALKPTEKDK
jgi:hypothetical protein